MYAVIETGGKQYRVEVGTELEVDLLEAEAGQSITLERVLLVADGAEATVGTPLVADAAVDAEVVGRERGDKVIAFKYRPKARRRVKKGHRQDLTLLRIADIRFQGRSASEGVAKKPSKAAHRQRLEEAAARQAAEDAALAAKLNLGTEAEGAAEAAPEPVKRTRAKAPAAAESKAAEVSAAKPVKAAKPAKPATAAKPAKPATATKATKPATAAKTTTRAKPAKVPKTAQATEGAEAAPAEAPARRRTRSKATDAASSSTTQAEPTTDAGSTGDTPKATPRRSRAKKDS